MGKVRMGTEGMEFLIIGSDARTGTGSRAVCITLLFPVLHECPTRIYSLNTRVSLRRSASLLVVSLERGSWGRVFHLLDTRVQCEALAFSACYHTPLAAPESTLSFPPNSSTYLVLSIYIPVLEYLSLSNLGMADVPTQAQRLALHDVGPHGQGSSFCRRGLTLAQAGSGARKWFSKINKKEANVPSKFIIPSRPFWTR